MRPNPVPRPARPRWARPLRRYRTKAALVIAVLTVATMVTGARYAASTAPTAAARLAAAAGSPFSGTAAAVPGTIQAANYDTGGPGVAYSVTSANGSANSYRSHGVDLAKTPDTQDPSPAGGAYDLGWTTSGQWFNYTVNAAAAGTYTVSFRVASPYGINDGLHIAKSV